MDEIFKVFTLIEWSFIILSYISLWYMMERRASNPKIRLRGIILNTIAGILQLIFLISIEIWSMALLSISFIPIKFMGIYNCLKEIREKKEENKNE